MAITGETLLRTITALAVAYAIFKYIVLPLRIWRHWWTAEKPQFDAVALNHPDISESVQAFFDDAERKLQPLGFVFATCMLGGENDPVVRLQHALFANPATGETVSAVVWLIPRSTKFPDGIRYMEFSTEYANGSMICTTDCKDGFGWQKPDWYQTWYFSGVSDIGQLYKTHCAVAAKYGHGTAAVMSLAALEERDAKYAARLNQYYAESGYLRLDKKAGRYRYTFRVMGMILKAFFPFKALRERRVERRKQAMLVELGLRSEHGSSGGGL